MSGMEKLELYEGLVGRCEFFKVVSLIESGAFVSCGFVQDLFVPVSQQHQRMSAGETHLIYVYYDEKTGRPAGSAKLNKYLYDEAPSNMAEGDQVDLIIFSQTDMGYKAVVNGDCWGLLYKNEIFQELHEGQKIKGYIKKIREDKRIDLILDKPGFQSESDLSEKIINHLKASGGTCRLSDKTPPEEIYELFGVSKKKFKMVIGNLYKRRLLVIEEGYIKWNQSSKIEGK
ncbi:MAG: GntR family transcriptional regulator [Candidatus Omnitrophota bacterium]